MYRLGMPLPTLDRLVLTQLGGSPDMVRGLEGNPKLAYIGLVRCCSPWSRGQRGANRGHPVLHHKRSPKIALEMAAWKKSPN